MQGIVYRKTIRTTSWTALAMRFTQDFKEPAVVLVHLNGGFTEICLERISDVGMANGGRWEIPTDKIPVHLRAIGSRFLVVGRFFTPEANDSPEDMRRACRDFISVVELTGEHRS